RALLPVAPRSVRPGDRDPRLRRGRGARVLPLREAHRDRLRVGSERQPRAAARTGCARSGRGGIDRVAMQYDYLYGLFVVALTFAALAVYGVRVMVRGFARYDRVNAVGGSPLLSKRLVEFGYWAIGPVARACVRAGITPNVITWGSLVLGVGAGVALAFGLLGLGALLALISTLSDS